MRGGAGESEGEKRRSCTEEDATASWRQIAHPSDDAARRVGCLSPLRLKTAVDSGPPPSPLSLCRSMINIHAIVQKRPSTASTRAGVQAGEPPGFWDHRHLASNWYSSGRLGVRQ